MESFTDDGWFKTGDYVTALLDNNTNQYLYTIEGRLSQDIIKKAGYKLSALEIENSILEHHEVAEICVMGVPCEKNGEEVAALLVFKTNS